MIASLNPLESTSQRILITGSSSGIGRAIALALALPGNTLGLHAREEREDFRRLQEELRNSGCTVYPMVGDLTTGSVVEDLVPTFVARAGGIDVLVNNAGAIGRYKSFSEIGADEFEASYRVNAVAPFLLCRAAFEYMKKGRGGRIINISSISVKYGGSPNSMHYAAAKGALETITRGFSRFGAEYNILVNSIRPGLIDTPLHSKTPKEDMRRRIDLVPLKRMGRPEEVAGLVAYLAGPQGSFTTGQIIEVAGGD